MVGSEVSVAGYAETVRGRGGVCFLMLRDGTGHIQAFLKKDNMDEALFSAIQSATRESTIQVTGTVAQKRPPKLAEGESAPPPEFEVNVTGARVLAAAAAPLPVGVTDDVHVALDVEGDELVQVTVGVVFFRPKCWPNLKDSLEAAQNC
jgi:aspartyl/asparaginyl-tRNA synthetase